MNMTVPMNSMSVEDNNIILSEKGELIFPYSDMLFLQQVRI